MAFRANMKKSFLKLFMVIGLVVPSLLPLNAAPPQTSGIIATITDLPEFTDAHLRVVRTSKGKKHDDLIPVSNQMTIQLPLSAGTYTLTLIPTAAPPSQPVIVDVARKEFIAATVAYNP